MAERKTKYTNADLKTGGPATEYGQWNTTKDNRKKSKDEEQLDRLLNEGTTVEDILAGARQSLSKAAPFTLAGREPQRQRFDATAADAQFRANNGPMEFVRGVRESPIAQGAMGLGAMIPSPVQPAFAGLLAADAATRVVEDPSITNAAIAALQVSPGIGMARTALRGRAAAQEGKQVAEGLYRGTGMSRGAERQYRMGSTPLSVSQDATLTPRNLSRLSNTEAVAAGQGPSGGARGVQFDPANLSRMSSTQAVRAGQGPSGGARGVRVRQAKPLTPWEESLVPRDLHQFQDSRIMRSEGIPSELDELPISLQVLDDAPVEQGFGTMDEVNALKASIAPTPRSSRMRAPNVIQQSNLQSIEAEMRAAGASESQIRQLYHAAAGRMKPTGEGVQDIPVSGLLDRLKRR